LSVKPEGEKNLMAVKSDTPLKWPIEATQIKQDRIETTITTTSTTYVATGLSITITTGNKYVLIFFTATTDNNTKDQHCMFQLRIDGTQKAYVITQSKQVNDPVQVAVAYTEVLSSGQHTIDVLWKVDAGTGRIFGNENGQLIAQELKC